MHINKECEWSFYPREARAPFSVTLCVHRVPPTFVPALCQGPCLHSTLRYDAMWYLLGSLARAQPHDQGERQRLDTLKRATAAARAPPYAVHFVQNALVGQKQKKRKEAAAAAAARIEREKKKGNGNKLAIFHTHTPTHTFKAECPRQAVKRRVSGKLWISALLLFSHARPLIQCKSIAESLAAQQLVYARARRLGHENESESARARDIPYL